LTNVYVTVLHVDRVVYVQGENSRETEAWFDVLSKALQVGE